MGKDSRAELRPPKRALECNVITDGNASRFPKGARRRRRWRAGLLIADGVDGQNAQAEACCSAVRARHGMASSLKRLRRISKSRLRGDFASVGIGTAPAHEKIKGAA